MAQTIKLKRSATAGNVPSTSDLELGEVALNTTDGKMYIKKSVGGTESIVELGTGGGGSAAADAIFVEYQYTATNNQTSFNGNDDNSNSLSYALNSIQVFLNGVLLDNGIDYTASNTVAVVLTEAATTGDFLQVFTFKKKISNGDVTVDTLSGNGSSTAYTLSVDPGVENNTRVYIDGVYQSKANYSVSGTTLTFSTAPPNGTAIEVEIGSRDISIDNTSAIGLLDNVKLKAGTGNDLEIFHDASNSYVKDVGTGNLKISSNNQVDITKGTSETMASFVVDGAVTLYHDNAAKIATSATGVTITGAAAATTFSGDLSGTINTATTATTQSAGNNSTKVATTAYVDVAIAALGDSAPNTLNTLNELAAALGDDANFAATTATALGLRVSKTADTGAAVMPAGTTAQRPTAAAGQFRYNSTLGKFEGYTDAWGEIGGGGAASFAADNFTGNGSTTAYALTTPAASEDNLLVFIEGVFQQQNAFSIATSGGTTTLTFSAAPANGNSIIIYRLSPAVNGTNLTSNTMTGDGSDTTLTLSAAPVNENNTQVFVNGVYQNKSTYSISGTTLTFSEAPPTGALVECMTMNQLDINVPVDDSITSAKLSGNLTTPGTLAVTGGITATTADNTDTLSLISTDADASAGPNLRMYRNSASPADADVLGVLEFEGRNDNSQDVVYAAIKAKAADVSDGTEDSSIFINSMVAGTLQNRITILPTEAVINEGSQDLDFRVESDANTHALFVQGSDGNVSIGTALSPQTFNVLGDYEHTGLYRDYAGSGTAATYLQIGRKDSNGDLVSGVRISGGGDDGVAASHNGHFEIATRKAGTFVSLLSSYSGGSELVVNDNSVDMDFRVESDGSAYALFVEGSSGNVGVGVSAPAALLHVNDPVSGNFGGEIRVGGTGSGRVLRLFQESATDYGLYATGTSSILKFGTAGTAGVGTERMRVTSAGKLVVEGTVAGYSGTQITVGSPSVVTTGLSVLSTTSGHGYLMFGDATGDATGGYVGQIHYGHSSNTMDIVTNGVKAVQWDSGGLQIANQVLADGRRRGMYGIYSPTHIAHIWSMGTAYSVATDGSTGGNLYGLCYSYEPDYGATGNNPGARSGLGHQMQWRSNGGTHTAIGNGIYTVGTVTANSDARLKTDIETIPNAMSKVSALTGITYKRTDLSEPDPATGNQYDVRHTGVLAQDLLAVLPEAVEGAVNGQQPEDGSYLSVAYGNMAGLFVEALKEQQATIEALTQRIETLENN